MNKGRSKRYVRERSCVGAILNYLLLLLIITLFSSLVSAETITVGVDSDMSIQQAINSAQDGDVVKLLAGEYYQSVKLHSKSGITLEGTEGVIISGGISGIVWEFLGEKTSSATGRVFKLWKARYPESHYWSSAPNDFAVIKLSKGNDEMFWTYPESKALYDNLINDNNGAGYYVTENKEIFLSSDEDPNELSILISQLDPVLSINESTGIVVKNITLKHGSRFLARVVNSENVHIDQVSLSNAAGNLMVSSSKNFKVTNSTFTNYWNFNWPWTQVKNGTYAAKRMEHNSIIISNGSSNGEISNSIIKNSFNGIFVGDGSDSIRITNNKIYNIPDDAIEPEVSAKNITVNNNIIFNVLVAISAAPLLDGPLYVYNNVLVPSLQQLWSYDHSTQKAEYNSGAALKVYGSVEHGRTRNIHVYNNTIYGPNGVNMGSADFVQKDDRYRVENISIYNNIVYSTNASVFRYSGLLQDNVMYGCNLFFTSSPHKWNFSYINSLALPNESSELSSELFPKEWVGNVYGDPQFTGDLSSLSLGNVVDSLKTSEESIVRSLRSEYDCVLPAEFPGSNELNSNRNIGALFRTKDNVPISKPRKPSLLQMTK